MYFVRVPQSSRRVTDVGFILETSFVVIASIYAVVVLFSWLFAT
jgi:hypothetical protein